MNVSRYLAVMSAFDGFILLGGLFAHSRLKPGFLNPPIGLMGNFTLPVTLLVAIGVTTILPTMLQRKSALRILTMVSATASLILVVIYVSSMMFYGRPISIPQRKITDLVIVGTERTKFANEYFDGVRDIDMLEERGWTDQDLLLYWSRGSLFRAQLSVLVGFVGTICSVNLLVASAAANSVASARNSKKHR